MKTLVIHPYDITTKFLEAAYLGKDWTIITDNSTSKKDIREAIKAHDRIIMMGHGSPNGLFGKGRLMIDSTYIHYLREKEIVAIWCNADKFVEKYDLKGFYTGMIISETTEAYFCNVIADQFDVDVSNELFTEAVTKSIDGSPDEMLKGMISEYQGSDNDVIAYNALRLYKR